MYVPPHAIFFRQIFQPLALPENSPEPRLCQTAEPAFRIADQAPTAAHEFFASQLSVSPPHGLPCTCLAPAPHPPVAEPFAACASVVPIPQLHACKQWTSAVAQQNASRSRPAQDSDAQPQLILFCSCLCRPAVAPRVSLSSEIYLSPARC